MRAIGHALFFFVVIAVLGAATHFSLVWLETTNFFAGPNGISVSRSTAYRVPSSEWLEFGITERGPIRVVSNCAFNQMTQNPTRYALDYELLDSSGEIIHGGRYHHRAKITLLRDPRQTADDPPIAKTSYAGTNLPSSNSVEFWIEAPDLNVPGRLRIRVAEHPDRVVEVAVRTYQRNELSPRKAKSTWQRLSRRKREQLTRGSAVPSDWLEPFETTALASFTWRPLGPRGVENEDYEERTLLIVNDPELERYRVGTNAPVIGRVPKEGEA